MKIHNPYTKTAEAFESMARFWMVDGNLEMETRMRSRAVEIRAKERVYWLCLEAQEAVAARRIK